MIVIYLSGTMAIIEIWKVDIKCRIIVGYFTNVFWTFLTQIKIYGQPPNSKSPKFCENKEPSKKLKLLQSILNIYAHTLHTLIFGRERKQEVQ